MIGYIFLSACVVISNYPCCVNAVIQNLLGNCIFWVIKYLLGDRELYLLGDQVSLG